MVRAGNGLGLGRVRQPPFRLLVGGAQPEPPVDGLAVSEDGAGVSRFPGFVSRRDGGPCGAADLGDAPVAHRGKEGEAPRRPAGMAVTLAMPLPEQVVENGLLDRAEPLAAGGRATLRGWWPRLRTEDAPVRLPTSGGDVVSAPLAFCDAAPVRDTTDRWPLKARVVAGVLGDVRETRLHRSSDLLLAARVRALAAAGRIEARGGDPRRRMAAGTEIRLSGRAAS